MQILTHSLKGLLNLFLESHCPLCSRNTSSNFCQDCTQQLRKCQIKDPSYLWQQPLPVFAWGRYDSYLKRAISLTKYGNQPQIAHILGEWLGEAWLLHSANHHGSLLVVPIPLHANKQKQRGYNQAVLIAKGFCQISGFRLVLNALERRKETKAQFGLSAAARTENLADAFAVRLEFCHSHRSTPVLLLDDIHTTGATAKSAAYTLRQSGIGVLGLAVVATRAKEG